MRQMPQKTVLITLGRLPKALDLARSFHRLGYRAIIAEPFRWHLSGASSAVAKSYQVTAPAINRHDYLADLLRIIHAESVSLVVPVSEEIIHASFLREHLPAGVHLYAMPSATLLLFHNKQTFINVCKEYALSAPDTFALDDERAAALARASDFIIKPIFSCSGRDVTFHSRDEALPAADSAHPMIVQRWVKGNVFSTFSIATAGRTVTTVLYKGAVMSGTVAVAFERVTASDAAHAPIRTWVERFISASDFTGFISFDFVVDSAGHAHAIECNPRATSGLHYVHVDDLAQAVVDSANGQHSERSLRFRDERLLQQFYPCLTEVQKSMFGGKHFLRNLGALIRAKDVSVSWRDPLPFLTMPLTAAQIIWLSIQRGCTFGEVATLDVGWY